MIREVTMSSTGRTMYPLRFHRISFTRLSVLRTLGAILAVSLLLPLTASAQEPHPEAEFDMVSVFPRPGTDTASPQTQITVRGIGAGVVPELVVRGSDSGLHDGRWVAHTDGRGGSLFLSSSFTSGESVVVQSSLVLSDAIDGTFSFNVATPASTSGLAEIDGTAQYLDESSDVAQLSTLDATVAPAATEPVNYRSRPDLHPPAIVINENGDGIAPGLLITAAQRGDLSKHQAGPMIYDNLGEPVWFMPFPIQSRSSYATKITWFGADALAWYDGDFFGPGAFNGEWVILDNTYQEIARVQAGNGYQSDQHEFIVTPADTALMLIYAPVVRDMTDFGGQPDATVIDAVVQELDLTTGAVLFEWHSLTDDGIPLTDAYSSLTGPFVDYVHPNSIDIDTDGNLLVSARNTSSIVKLDRATGEIIWLLGGKRSTFTFPNDTGPNTQHDARRRPDGTLSIYDNGNRREPPFTRGVAWELNETTWEATRAAEWRRTPDVFTPFTGNTTTLPNDNTLINWSGAGIVTEYNDTEPVFEAQWADGGINTYRTAREEWQATPAEPPAIAVDQVGPEATAYASWNGATEVTTWNLLAGPSEEQMRVIGSAPRDGFETTIAGPFAASDVVFRAQAVGSEGEVLGTSPATRAVVQWGTPGDILVPADFDGDGADEIAVWRPSSGNWYQHNGGAVNVTQWGTPGDIPVPADFDGDGADEIAVWRPSSGNWYQHNGGAVNVTQWGTPGDIPVPADFDGDGADEIAVWRPSSGNWYQHNGGAVNVTQWGAPGDIPVPAGYYGDGTDRIVVWRPSDGIWHRHVG